MSEDEDMAELRAQEAKRVRDEAKKCLRHASFQLGKAAYEIDEYLKEFSTARISIRRQVILNEAIAHLVANVLPNLGIAEMARAQVQLALRDFNKSAYWGFDSEVRVSDTQIEVINHAASKPPNSHAKQIDSRTSHLASSLIYKRAALSVFRKYR